MNPIGPKVSIIVPIYNVAKYLRQCLDSLVNQTLTDIEIICVNDGSTDESPKIIQEYAARDNRIIIVDKPNGGLSDARNAGLSHVRGKYFMFIDGDDWLDLNACNDTYIEANTNGAQCVQFSYVKEFGTHKVVNHVFDEERIVWNHDEVIKNFHRRLVGPIDKELSRPQDLDLIVTACMQLYETETCVALRFYDNRKIGSFEDGLYQIMLYGNCRKYVYIDKPFYHYRKDNATSITSSYNPYLFDRWQHLYDILEQNLASNNLHGDYETALRNRIALGMIGICLNQSRAKTSLSNSAQRLDEILSTERYSASLCRLDTSMMPIHWKLFFALCKIRATKLLIILSKAMEYLRTHKH